MFVESVAKRLCDYIKEKTWRKNKMGIGLTRDEQEEGMSVVEQIRKRHSIWEWREGRLEKLSQCREGHDTRHFYGWLTDIDNLLKEIDSLCTKLEAAESILRKLEWNSTYDYSAPWPCCPVCKGIKPGHGADAQGNLPASSGHHQDCRLAKAIGVDRRTE